MSTSPAETHRIAIAGASGRMGRTLVEAVLAAPDCSIGAALDMPGSPALGQDAGAFAGVHTGVAIRSDLYAALQHVRYFIDFTRPEGTMAHLAACEAAGVAMVIGTTGFDEAQLARIRIASQRIAIVMAPNMSIGVNVVFKLLEQAARALAQGYDIEIIEAHHRHKVDAPSGTALLLGEAAAQGRAIGLAEQSIRVRDGHTGPRPAGAIGFASLRGGSVVGEHSVILAGPGERIVLSHQAEDRTIFARGAVKAALWAHGRKPGLYSMRDVLGLND